MVARCVGAWWPVVGLVAVAALSPWTSWPVRFVLLFAVAYAELRWHAISLLARRAWWRSCWWFDARSAGLVIVGDPFVNAEHERGGRMATGLELAPPLLRVRCSGPSRLYVVRTLPGQLVDDFERAIPLLAHRWRAEVAVSEHPRRRRTVLIEVVRADVLEGVLPAPERLLRGR